MLKPVDRDVLSQIPFGQYEVVNVQFGAANVDTPIPVSLGVETPLAYRWMDITPNAGAAITIYRGATTVQQHGTLLLRCNAANYATRLLIFTERTEAGGAVAPATSAASVAAASVVSDSAYGATWDGDTTTAPSKNAVYDKINALGGSWTEQTTTATGTQPNFSLNGHKIYLRCTGAAPSFSGFTIGGVTPTAESELLIECLGTTAKVTNQDTGSTAANRVVTPSAVGQIVGAGGLIYCKYDATTGRWREHLLDAGGFISVPYSAGDFTASGAMTWTVDAADVAAYVYKQHGTSLEVSISVQTSTVGGVASFGLRAALPNGFTLATGTRYALCYAFNNALNLTGYLAQTGSGTTIDFRLMGGNWTLETNATYCSWTGSLVIN